MINYFLRNRNWFCIVKTINHAKPKGKLSLVPTPIGNMNDLSPNIVKCLYHADLIGCQDRRVAGQLYSLIKNKKIISRLEQKFGTFGLSNLILKEEGEQIKMDETEQQHRFYNYSHMNDKQRRKFVGKMTIEQEKEFKIQYLKYRAKKIVRNQHEFLFKKQTSKFDELYGIQTSDLQHIQSQIHNTRVRKGRGLLIPMNTYSQTKMFDMIKALLQSKHVAIVSDAGMPCISDPGWRLVKNIRQTMPQVNIQVVGGPSAVDIMLTLAKMTSKGNSMSGRFEGFASPQVSNITEESIKINKDLLLSKEKDFSIHFINSKKLKKKAHSLQKIYGSNHNIVIGNELTKKYERKFHGKLKDLSEQVSKQNKQFDGIGELSYLLYSSNQTFQQPNLQNEENDEGNRNVTIDVKHFISCLSDTQLTAKDKAELICSIFGLRMNEARKMVYGSLKSRKKEI